MSLFIQLPPPPQYLFSTHYVWAFLGAENTVVNLSLSPFSAYIPLERYTLNK